jgi:beta-glucosidase
MTHDVSFSLEVSFSIRNTGSVAGSEVAQVYICCPDIGISTPKYQMRGFTKARDIQPGTETRATVKLDKYAVSFWDEPKGRWKATSGKYGVFIGRSCTDLVLEGSFELKKSFYWSGL